MCRENEKIKQEIATDGLLLLRESLKPVDKGVQTNSIISIDASTSCEPKVNNDATVQTLIKQYTTQGTLTDIQERPPAECTVKDITQDALPSHFSFEILKGDDGRTVLHRLTI